MKTKTFWWAVRGAAVLVLAVAIGALAEPRTPRHLGGVINDYTPISRGMTAWEVRGPWNLNLKRESGRVDFSAALTAELSVLGQSPANVSAASLTQHTHHITIENGTVTPIQTGGFELSGPATITKDGGPAPLAASMLYVDITGGPDVEFSNITMKFEGGATVHFGSQTIHGVVRNPDKRDGDRD